MDVTKVVGIEFDSGIQAREVHEDIERRADEGALDVAVAVLLCKNDRGQVTTRHYGSGGTSVGVTPVGITAGTAITGLGLLGIINPIVGIALIGGAATGALAGSFFSDLFGEASSFEDIAEGLHRGRAYVLVATDDAGARSIHGDSSILGEIEVADVTPELLDDLRAVYDDVATENHGS